MSSYLAVSSETAYARRPLQVMRQRILGISQSTCALNSCRDNHLRLDKKEVLDDNLMVIRNRISAETISRFESVDSIIVRSFEMVTI